ncbi:hypothetical protein cypCar_00030139 [Cyprinus carpio]|nr:hypothetical protein cypCar_00030139 [Cyprinus carpio]
MPSQSASSTANSSQYLLSSHQPEWRSSCSPVVFMMTNTRAYVYVISGGCCSLQPTAQPVTEQVSSSVKSESEQNPEETVSSSSISMLSLCCGCCKPNRENSENDPERCE